MPVPLLILVVVIETVAASVIVNAVEVAEGIAVDTVVIIA